MALPMDLPSGTYGGTPPSTNVQLPQQNLLPTASSTGQSVEQQALAGGGPDNKQQVSNFIQALNQVGAGTNNNQMSAQPAQQQQPQFNILDPNVMNQNGPGPMPSLTPGGGIANGSFTTPANPMAPTSLQSGLANLVNNPVAHTGEQQAAPQPTPQITATTGGPTTPTASNTPGTMLPPPPPAPLPTSGLPTTPTASNTPATFLPPPPAPSPTSGLPTTPTASNTPATILPPAPPPPPAPTPLPTSGLPTTNTVSNTPGTFLPPAPAPYVDPYPALNPNATFNYFSDENLKTNINPADNKLQDFMSKIGAHSYTYKNPELDGQGTFTSPMAQELLKTDLGKQAVTKTDRGYMVDYGRLGGVNLAALSVLNSEQKRLQDQVNELKRKMKL